MIGLTTLQNAQAHLRRVDPILAELITRVGDCRLGQTAREPFHVLCASIIGQQLSSKAADTIQARVAKLIDAPMQHFTAAHFAHISKQALRGCGLSQAKSSWLLELAARSESGRFNPEALAQLPDNTLQKALDDLPGIGPWTAEMMLIFAFDRLDVFSMGDAALRRSMNKWYSHLILLQNTALSESQVLELSAAWSPYRSIASWYLWRALEKP